MGMLGLEFGELLSAIARWSLCVELEFASIICGDGMNKSPDGWIWAAGIASRWMEACWVASRELPVALNNLEFARLVGGDEILAKSPVG